MKQVIPHALLPAFYLVALPVQSAQTLPAPFEAKRQSTVPDDLLTNTSYRDGWNYIQEKWAAGYYSSLTLKDRQYLLDREIIRLTSTPDIYTQRVTLLDHSYSQGNILNSVQLDIGDGLNDASHSEANDTVVRGTYVKGDGSIQKGSLMVHTGGRVFNTTVETNGALTLNGSSEAYNTLVQSGGTQIVGSNAYAQANVIDGGTQQLQVMSNAVAEDTIVMNGGQQIVYGGTARNSHIGADSYQLASGLVLDTVLYDGAFQQVYAGSGETGIADRDTSVLAGARQQITYGISENAQVYGLQLISGVDGNWRDGDWQSDTNSKIRVNGQTSRNATIHNGGEQRIQTGNADGARVYGLQTISGQKGGWIDGQWQDQQGYIGGVRANATNTTVYSGGVQHLAWYGEADQTLIDSGSQIVDALGHISNTTIRNGGSSSIAWGGYSTGTLNVENGALTMQGGGYHDWTGNLGKGAWAAAVDLQSKDARLFVRHNADAGESVVTISQLTNNGVVNFGAADGSDSGSFSRLELDTLSGAGTFVMNTNLSGGLGDFLNVASTVSGNFAVRVQDSGQELRSNSASPYHLIHASGSATDTFSMTNGSVDLGAWKYYLVHGAGEDKDNWYLSPQAVVQPQPEPDPEPTPGPQPEPEPTPEPQPEPEPTPEPQPEPEPTPEPQPEPGPTPEPQPEPGPQPDPNPAPQPEPKPQPGQELSESAKAVIAMANVTPTIWDAELSTLRTRLGEVRSGQAEDGGAWGKYITSRYRISTRNLSYRQDMNGVMLGGDKRITLTDGQLLLGGMVSYTRSSLDASSTNGKVDSFGIGAYLTWLHNSGYYLDSVLKANRFRTENNPRFNGGRTHASDDTNGAGISLEIGRHIAFGQGFVEPYVQMAMFRGGKSEYRLDSGMKVRADAAKSVKGELGITLGRKFSLASGALIQPYARLAVRQEFMKNNDVIINDTERFANDMSGITGRYGLGVTASLNERWSAYGELNYEMGSHIETPYSGHIGFRYSF